MADRLKADELIQKYFDDIITEPELAELQKLLIADREAARLFTKMARTDHLVYSHFNASRAKNAIQFEIERAPAPTRAVIYDLSKIAAQGPRKWRWKNFVERLWGPTGSVLIHVVLILFLIRFAVVQTREKQTEIEITLAEPNEAKIEDIDQTVRKEIEQIPELPQVESAVKPPDVGTMVEQSVGDLATPGEGTGTGLGTGPGAGDMGGMELANDVQSKLVMRDLYQGRSADGRKDALATYGGAWGQYTEVAVIKALEWLKKKQNADGSWGPNKTAMTGLALLTYLAHGETTSSTNYGPTVEKAIRFLMAQQDADGFFARSKDSGEGGDPTVYAHGIATYAISEAYGLIRIPSLKLVLEKAVQVILNGQQPTGGWNYRFSKSGRRDTSVSGWMIQALKSAYIAGAENPGLREAMEKAVADLRAVHNSDTGRFGYTDKNGGSIGCTGIGVLCMQLLGHAADKEVRQGLQALKEASVKWDSEQKEGWPLYEWYYITQAKFHQGGTTWSNWNSSFAKAYVKAQNADGSWPPAAQSEAGIGPVYSTTFAALTLQVYYRFLPTYKPIAVQPATETSTNDVQVEIF